MEEIGRKRKHRDRGTAAGLRPAPPTLDELGVMEAIRGRVEDRLGYVRSIDRHDIRYGRHRLHAPMSINVHSLAIPYQNLITNSNPPTNASMLIEKKRRSYNPTRAAPAAVVACAAVSRCSTSDWGAERKGEWLVLSDNTCWQGVVVYIFFCTPGVTPLSCKVSM